jgi:NADPH-dependent curcumin reductase CurA
MLPKSAEASYPSAMPKTLKKIVEIIHSMMTAKMRRGRVSVCGAISHYNEQGGYSKVMDVLPLCVFKVTLNVSPKQL